MSVAVGAQIMTKDKNKKAVDSAQEAAGPIAQPVAPDAESARPVGGAALVEQAPEAITRLETELGDARTALAQSTDKYLRLAAEFDNFRKRAVRERTEQRARAQADVVARLVDALDDLARFAHVDPGVTDAKTIHDGVDMVERKLWKELEGLGVTRVDQLGVPFDPNVHEAVTMLPAREPLQDHTVGAVLQAGYKLGDALIRPARVVVLMWQGGSDPAAPAVDPLEPTGDG